MFTVGFICHDGFISLHQVITFGVFIIETVWMNCFENFNWTPLLIMLKLMVAMMMMVVGY